MVQRNVGGFYPPFLITLSIFSFFFLAKCVADLTPTCHAICMYLWKQQNIVNSHPVSLWDAYQLNFSNKRMKNTTLNSIFWNDGLHRCDKLITDYLTLNFPWNGGLKKTIWFQSFLGDCRLVSTSFSGSLIGSWPLNKMNLLVFCTPLTPEHNRLFGPGRMNYTFEWASREQLVFISLFNLSTSCTCKCWECV